MTTEELKNMVQLYFDGELEKNKETLLFISLSQNHEGQDYFKSMNRYKLAVEETETDFPEELEERIFYSLKKKEINARHLFKKTPINRAVSYSLIAVTAVLIIINLYLLGRLSSYNDKINAVETLMQRQNQMIELFYNSLPSAEIKAKWGKEIIIKSNL